MRSRLSRDRNLCAESDYAQSKLDFINKRSIARKEYNESKYWIAMMRELGFMDHPTAERSKQAEELMRLLTSGTNRPTKFKDEIELPILQPSSLVATQRSYNA